MKVVWRERAEQQLQHQLNYLRKQNPRAADRARDRIELRVARLARFPHTGRLSRRPGVRELIITGTPYIAVYRVDSDEVTILRFFHTSQKR